MWMAGGREYVEIPGTATLELPPLLVSEPDMGKKMCRVMGLASKIVESEEFVEEGGERRRFELALNLAERYRDLVRAWKWGDAILEWVRQCEMTFEAKPNLRPLLRPHVWPHAGRASFVMLLEDKHVDTQGVAIEPAVGLRLAFRQAPPLEMCSDQFLFYLNSRVGESAFETWAALTPPPVAWLPPERFSLQVVAM